MTINRLFPASLAAILCICLVAVAVAAPSKKHAHPKAPVSKTHKPGVAPMPVKAAPSPTPSPDDVVLYDGRSLADEGLTLAPWGGGSVDDTHEISFSKGHALKVTTLDPYEGAKVTFNSPTDLTDKTRFFALTLRVPQTTRSFAEPTFGRSGRSRAFEVATASSLRNIRLTFTLANGAQTDVLRALPEDTQNGQDQWVTLAVPLAVLTFPAGGAPTLQSITIAGDDYGVLYVGQIRLTHDTTPITCFAGDQQTVAIGQPVTLSGSASGGLSALQYAWNFDDKGSTVEQAFGPSVGTQYLKPGVYKATLTVSDPDGIKKSATSTTEIHVE